MFPNAKLTTTKEIQQLTTEDPSYSIIVIPHNISSLWVDEFTEAEILMHYEPEIEKLRQGPKLRKTMDLKLILLQTPLQANTEMAIEQLTKATKQAQLELIITTILKNHPIPKELEEKIKNEAMEIIVTEEAQNLIAIIKKTQLQNVIMGLENEILLCEQENIKQAKTLFEKVKSQTSRIQEIISPEFKNHEDTHINAPTPIYQNSLNRSMNSNYQESLFSVNDIPDKTIDNFHQLQEQNQNTTKLQAIKMPRFDPSDIETSLTQLEILSNNIPTQQHGQLIITFLASASKLGLLSNANERQRADVEQLTTMIRKELGLNSKSALSKNLSNIEQTQNENFFQLKQRITTTYKRLHEKQTLSSADQAIIVQIFVKSLKNDKIKRQLQLEDITFENVLRRANTVKQVVEQTQTSNPEDQHLIESLYAMMTSTKCNDCGLSHNTSDCLASTKLLSKWRKTNGTSKDQGYNNFTNINNSANRDTNHNNQRQQQPRLKPNTTAQLQPTPTKPTTPQH